MWLINTTTFEREFRQQESSSSAELSEAINSMFRWYEMEFWPCIDLQPLRSPLLPNSNLKTTDKESQTFTRALGTVLGVKSSPGRPGESGSATQVLCRHTAEGGSAGEGVRESIAKWDSWPAEYAAAQLQELYSPDSIPNGHFSGVFILPEINYPLLYVVRIAPDMRSLSAKFAIETNLEVPAVYGRISMSRQRGLDKT
ncbi:hypothetical protein M0657_009603 [Pyricularia oryzae]|nr:hypothetical protein M0657_009603 [Pyricularia oryzae]